MLGFALVLAVFAAPIARFLIEICQPVAIEVGPRFYPCEG